MTRALPRIWLITDRKRVNSPLPAAVKRALQAAPPGIAGVILREKYLGDRELLALARELRAVTHAFDSPLVVNGRFDVAMAAKADGVHLGHDAPPFEDVKRIARDLRVGVSIHGTESPPETADYALLAPIFTTQSKPDATPVGLEHLAATCARTKVPIYALGGISASNAAECIRAGAYGVASLGAVLGATDSGVAMTALARQLPPAVNATAAPPLP